MHKRKVYADRSGFALFWVLMVVTLVMVGVSMIPLSGLVSSGRAAAEMAAGTLLEVDSAMVRFHETSVKKHPSRLWMLATHPRNNDKDFCGGNFGGATANSDTTAGWRGPYVTRFIRPDTGFMAVRFGQVSDTIIPVEEGRVRQGNRWITNYGLLIRIRGVTEANALLLDAQVDTLQTARPDTAGQVRWSQPTGNDRTTNVTYKPLRTIAC